MPGVREEPEDRFLGECQMAVVPRIERHFSLSPEDRFHGINKRAGQESVKKARSWSNGAGGHNVLMIGPPKG